MECNVFKAGKYKILISLLTCTKVTWVMASDLMSNFVLLNIFEFKLVVHHHISFETAGHKSKCFALLFVIIIILIFAIYVLR